MVAELGSATAEKRQWPAREDKRASERRRHERRCDQRLATGAALPAVSPAGPDPPAAREALMTAPHGRRSGRTTNGPSYPGPGRHSWEITGSGGGTRGAVISASPPTPPCLTRPHADAGCTRGAEYSASGPAAAREKGEAEGPGAKDPGGRRCFVARYRGGPATGPRRRRHHDEALSSERQKDPARRTQVEDAAPWSTTAAAPRRSHGGADGTTRRCHQRLPSTPPN